MLSGLPGLLMIAETLLFPARLLGGTMGMRRSVLQLGRALMIFVVR
jgi:hypothetical protein